MDIFPSVKKGIEIFCRQHPQTCFIYDIKHKVAAILKRELKDDQDWNEFVKLAESFIKFNGVYRDCHIDLMQVEGFDAHRKRTIRLREELLDFISQQSDQAKPNERLLGSSEVIESVIGKLKNMEADQNKSGFTGLLLSLAAIVSKTTEDVIHKVMESVPTKRVHEWIEENIGKSVQSKRKEVFSSVRKAEQKWDEFESVFE